jgi:hypothetical protein
MTDKEYQVAYALKHADRKKALSKKWREDNMTKCAKWDGSK